MKPLITHNFKIEESLEAFKTAETGIGNAIKVMIHCDQNIYNKLIIILQLKKKNIKELIIYFKMFNLTEVKCTYSVMQLCTTLLIHNIFLILIDLLKCVK